MEENKSFITLIGAGYWGKNLLRDLYTLGVLHSVCEASQILIEKHKSTYSDLLFLSNVEDIKKYKEVTAVCIATPAVTHYSLVRDFLENDYDVFVEKPLALNYNEGKELIQLAERKNKILMVGHILQYHPAIKMIKSMILEDYIGNIQYIKSNRLNLGKIRKCENVLWSFAPHDISVILSLMDEQLPTQIKCSGFATLNPPICDISTTILNFDHQYAEINVNWLFPYKEQSLVIVGEKGMITFKDSPTNPILQYYPQPITFDSNNELLVNKKTPINISFNDNKEEESPLTLECKHFIECCKNRTKPITDGNEALRVLGVLELAQKSIEQNGKPFTFADLKKVSHNNYNKSNIKIHESATINELAEIGENTKIWHNCHVMNCIIGKNCSLGQNVFIGNNVIIGDNCRIQNNVNLYSGVVCESGVFFGPNCTTTNDKNPRAEYSKNGNYLKTIFKKGATIGAGAVILPNITIGSYSLVGAGSVVTHDVPDYTVVAGNPAKPIGTITETGKINNKN